MENNCLTLTNNNSNLREHKILLGDRAPDFTAKTTMGQIKLSDYTGNWIVLFSHPRRLYTSLHN